METDRLVGQVAAMADADMVQVLALLLAHERGMASAAELVGGPTARWSACLEELVQVGLAEHAPGSGEVRYRPTFDALARFGSLAPTAATPHPPLSHGPVLDRVAEQLTQTYAGVFAAQTVHRYVQESYALLAARARVSTHLPLLASRYAADRLAALARASGARRGEGTEVLFVCVHNAARSQIAAAALRHHSGGSVQVRSAGSRPAGRIDPVVARVLRERGWADVLEFPKPLTDEVVRSADYVVTLGCGDACPVYPGRRYLDWAVADPTGVDETGIRALVDQIESRVLDLADELTSS